MERLCFGDFKLYLQLQSDSKVVQLCYLIANNSPHPENASDRSLEVELI